MTNSSANLEKLQEHERSRRSVTSHNITIEMAVYIDAAYTQTMLVTDFSKRLQHILLKYYAVGIMESSLPMGWRKTSLFIKFIFGVYNISIQMYEYFVKSRQFLNDAWSIFLWNESFHA